MFLYLLWNLYQLKKNTARNEEQIKVLQEKKLRKLLRYAYHNSAYYHRTFTQAGISEENIDRISLKQFPVIPDILSMMIRRGVDGLKDYQFVQTTDKSFQIRAEISEDASKETVIHGIESIIEPLLSDKELGNIYYEICFVESVTVNADTGKKPLIIKQINNGFNTDTMSYEAV